MVSFNIGTFITNTVQELLEQCSTQNINLAFPVYEDKRFAIICSDELVARTTKLRSTPQMVSTFVDGFLIILVNSKWSRQVPLDITKTLYPAEVARYNAEATTVDNIDEYCDDEGIKAYGNEYVKACMYLHEHYPGAVISLTRIEYLSSSAPDLKFRFAQLFLRS